MLESHAHVGQMVHFGVLGGCDTELWHLLASAVELLLLSCIGQLLLESYELVESLKAVDDLLLVVAGVHLAQGRPRIICRSRIFLSDNLDLLAGARMRIDAAIAVVMTPSSV